MTREEQIEIVKSALTLSVDGADIPHQEALNKTRYLSINKMLREVLKSLKSQKQEKVEIEGMKDADYVNVYVNRSERTMSDMQNALLDVDGRIMAVMHAVMGLQKEIGDIAELINDRVVLGSRISPARISDEIGSMLWFLSILLREFDISFEEVMLENLAKLDKKYPNAGVLSVEDDL